MSLRRTRLSAILAAFAVVAATIAPALPANADETPPPTPVVVEPTETPTPDASAPPEEDPAPEVTDPAVETPTPEPTNPTTPAPGSPPPNLGGNPVAEANPGDPIRPSGTFGIGGTLQVGQTLSLLPLTWKVGISPEETISPALDYQWYRNGVAVSSGPTYLTTSADFQKSITLRVTATLAPYTTFVSTTNAAVIATAAPLAGSRAGHDVVASGVFGDSVNPLTLTVQRQVGDITTPDVTVTYQWLRAGTPIGGATASTYRPTALDTGLLEVNLTFKKVGYLDYVQQSPARDYSLRTNDSSAVQAAALLVGREVAVSPLQYFTYTGSVGTPPVELQHQWLRNGVAIPGATGETYRLAFADLGKAISFRTTASLAGWIPNVKISAATAPIETGAFNGSLVVPVNTDTPQTITAVPFGVSAPTGTITYSYQWYRQLIAGGTPAPIAGATGASYHLLPADWGTFIYVQVQAKNPGYNDQAANSLSKNYSVTPSVTVPVLVGEQRIGKPLTVGFRTYTVPGFGPSSVSATVTYSWFRDGVLIPGTTGVGTTFATYIPTAAESGKAITVKAVAEFGNALPAIATSLPTQKLASFTLPGAFTPLPSVFQTPGTLKLEIGGSGVTEPGVTTAYQWLRSGVAITGATAATYTMTAADAAKTISVRVTVSKALFTTIVKTSPAIDYSIRVDEANQPYIDIPITRVGQTATATDLNFLTKDGALTGGAITFQWLRSGVVIPGATQSTYVVTGAELSKQLTVRVTATKPGYLPVTFLTGPTGVIETGTIQGTLGAPNVVVGATLKLSVDLSTAITTPSATYAYTWLRDGTTTVGTASTYQLTAADQGRTISVRVTVSKPGFTTVILPTTPAKNYSVAQNMSPNLTDFDPAVGVTIGVNLPDYSLNGSPLTPSSITYQWLRAGVAIAGATGATYAVQSADFGKKLSVRVTASEPGALALVWVTGSTSPVVAGVITGSHAAPTVAVSATGLLSVTITPGSVAIPSPTLTYKWLRDGNPIPTAIAATYLLAAADRGHLISVRVTASKPNATPAAFVLDDSAQTTYDLLTLGGAGPSIANATPRIGDALTVTLPTYATPQGFTVDPTLTYQWCKVSGLSCVAIAGATLPTYSPLPADVGAFFKVSVTAKYPALVGMTQQSSVSPQVGAGIIAGAANLPKFQINNPATNTYTAFLQSGTVTTPGVTYSYQWYRKTGSAAPVAITGQTGVAYTLQAGDFDDFISVGVIVKKPGYQNRDLGLSAGQNFGLFPDPAWNFTVDQNHPIATGEYLWAGLGTEWYNVDQSVFTGSIPAYQWLRNGVAIAGATNMLYEIGSADYNQHLSVRVVAKLPGYLTRTLTSPESIAVPMGSIQGTFNSFGINVVPDGIGKVKVELGAGYLTTTGVTAVYRWYRNGSLIVGASGSTYTLTSLDQDPSTYISADVQFSKANHLPVPLKTANQRLVSINLVAGAVSLDGFPQVGGTLTVNPAQFAAADGVVAVPTIVWMRQLGAAAPVAIAGQTGLTYEVKPGDVGYAIFAKVTPTSPGSIHGAIATNSADPAVLGSWTGSFTAPTVDVDPITNTLTGSLTAGILTPGPVAKFTWLRDDVPIPGATTTTYKLTAADYGHYIRLRVRLTKPGFDTAPEPPDSNPVNYSLHAGAGEQVIGQPNVGEPLTLHNGTYLDASGGSIAVGRTVTWYRQKVPAAAVLIAGASGKTYTPVAADVGFVIRAKVTASSPGYLGFTGVLTDPSQPIAVGMLHGTLAAPIVTQTPGTLKLTASLPVGAFTDSPTIVYQWYRGSSPIVGAKLPTYTLVAADANQAISVAGTASKAGYTTYPLSGSGGINYSITTEDFLSVGGVKQVGYSASLDSVNWDLLGSHITPTIGYQWLRNNVAIPGGTGAVYPYVAADIGNVISVRLTLSAPGAVTRTVTSQPTPAIVAGQFSGSRVAATVVENNPTMTLTGSLTPGSVNETGLTLTYQWFRETTPIAGATAAVYKLVAEDKGHTIKVRITFKKSGYSDVLPLESNGSTYTLGGNTIVMSTVSAGGPHVNEVIQPLNGSYDRTPDTRTYQWYRKTGSAAGVPIPGILGQQSSYFTTPADVGSSIYVVVTATYPGFFPNVQQVGAVGPVVP